MGIMNLLIRQGGKPAGRIGRLIGKGMNLGHSAQWQWALERISIDPEDVVLDIGCGGGQALKSLAGRASKGKVFGIDHSEEMVDLSRRTNGELIEGGRVEVVHGEVSSLPFADEMFHLVTAFDTFYFWPHHAEDLKEVIRVLYPGGRLLLFNEGYRQEKLSRRGAQFEKAAGVELQTPAETCALLSQAGYTDIELALRPEEDWFLAIAKKKENITE
ncbi:MAG: class I SAM-dependent methyltransferase [Actinobacteria bacterium]|nr:class I SAM-dependent methyltransferase [Actinomycetota bacterium]